MSNSITIRLVRLVTPFWLHSEKLWLAWLMLGAGLALQFVATWATGYAGELSGYALDQMQSAAHLSIQVGTMDGATFTAAREAVHQKWLYLAELYLALTIPFMLASALSDWLRTKLAWMWYAWMSKHLFAKAFRKKPGRRGAVILQAVTRDKRTDNPWQILTQELESLCMSFTGLAVAFLRAFIDGGIFGYQLYLIAAVVSKTALAYSAVGSIAVIAIGWKLQDLNQQQSKADADMRQRINDTANGDLPDGETLALEDLEAKMVVVNRSITINAFISVWNAAFDHLTGIVPILVMGHFFFRNGLMQIGSVAAAVYIFGKLVTSLTVLAKQFPGFSAMVGSISRLGKLDSLLEEYGAVYDAAAGDPEGAVEEHLQMRLRQWKEAHPDEDSAGPARDAVAVTPAE